MRGKSRGIAFFSRLALLIRWPKSAARLGQTLSSLYRFEKRTSTSICYPSSDQENTHAVNLNL